MQPGTRQLGWLRPDGGARLAPPLPPLREPSALAAAAVAVAAASVTAAAPPPLEVGSLMVSEMPCGGLGLDEAAQRRRQDRSSCAAFPGPPAMPHAPACLPKPRNPPPCNETWLNVQVLTIIALSHLKAPAKGVVGLWSCLWCKPKAEGCTAAAAYSGLLASGRGFKRLHAPRAKEALHRASQCQ